MYKVRVYHSYYGCETGCCGHRIEISDNEVTEERFQFEHPRYKESDEDFARRLAEATIRYYWPQCLETIDWNTFEFEIVDDLPP